MFITQEKENQQQQTLRILFAIFHLFVSLIKTHFLCVLQEEEAE